MTGDATTRSVVADDIVVSAYRKHGSVWRAGEEVGLSAECVRRRLKALGIQRTDQNHWSDDDLETLRREYIAYRNIGKLQLLADRLGRSKTKMCRKAGELGLTNQKGPKPYLRVWTKMGRDECLPFWEAFKASSLGLRAYCKKKNYGLSGFTNAMKLHFPDEWDHVMELKAPKSNKYRLGRAFEYRTRDHLKERGYFVLRSPMSRSPVDLVAIRRGEVLFVQCKRGGYVGVEEWNALFDLAASTGAVPLVASTLTRGVNFQRMTGRKGGRRVSQPMEPFIPGEVAA